MKQWGLLSHFTAISVRHRRALFVRLAATDQSHCQETLLTLLEIALGPLVPFGRITLVLTCSLHTGNYACRSSWYYVTPALAAPP